MVWGKTFFDMCLFERGEGVKLLFGECTFVPELEGELGLTRQGTNICDVFAYISISISLLSL